MGSVKGSRRREPRSTPAGLVTLLARLRAERVASDAAAAATVRRGLRRSAGVTIAERPGTTRHANAAPPRGGVVRGIADRRLAELGPALDAMTAAELRQRVAKAPPPRPFALRLAEPGLHLIAEIKRRSPSAGAIAGNGEDILARARAYETGWRRCDLGALRAALVRWLGRGHGPRPPLREPPRAREGVRGPPRASSPCCADTAPTRFSSLPSCIRGESSATLVAEALDLGLEPLVEAHDEKELEAALATGARVIGINNRDLRTLDVDPERASRLRELIPEDRIAIAESGVRDASTIRGWRALGFDAALVGRDPRSRRRPGSDGARIHRGRADRPTTWSKSSRAPFVKICGIVDEAGVEAAAPGRRRRGGAEPRARHPTGPLAR